MIRGGFLTEEDRKGLIVSRKCASASCRVRVDRGSPALAPSAFTEPRVPASLLSKQTNALPPLKFARYQAPVQRRTAK